MLHNVSIKGEILFITMFIVVISILWENMLWCLY